MEGAAYDRFDEGRFEGRGVWPLFNWFNTPSTFEFVGSVRPLFRPLFHSILRSILHIASPLPPLPPLPRFT